MVRETRAIRGCGKASPIGGPERLWSRAMIQTPVPAIDPALESLLAFWAEAGVDASYEDAPVDRLAQGAARLAAKAKTPTRPTAGPTALAGVLTPTADIGAAVAQAREMAAAAPPST